MNAYLPFFRQKDDPFDEILTAEIITRAVLTVRSLPFISAISVMSDDASALAAAKNENIYAKKSPARPHTIGCLPWGAGECLTLSGPFLILNPRAMRLSADILQKAYNTCRSEQTDMAAGVTNADAHPCQGFLPKGASPLASDGTANATGFGFARRERFCPPGAPWREDSATGLAVNTVTGEKITGRQQFPKIFKADGSFIIILSIIGGSMLRQPEKVSVSPILLPEKHILIRNHLDLLRHRRGL